MTGTPTLPYSVKADHSKFADRSGSNGWEVCRVGKAKRAHLGPFQVGTARKSAPLPTTICAI